MLHASIRRFAVAALAGFLSAPLAFADRTLTVEESVTLPAKPAEIWSVVGDFGNLQAWLPVVSKSEITKGDNNTVGAVRSLETRDGAKIDEQLLRYDAHRMSMRYKFIAAPLPVTDYVSTLRVLPAGKNSRVVWKGSFKAKGVSDAKAREIFVGIYKGGFEALQAKFGK